MTCRVAAIVLSFFICSCGILPQKPTQEPVLFELQIPSCAEYKRTRPLVKAISVPEATAQGLYRSNKIIFQRTPLRFGRYQYAFWATPPSARVAEIVRAELRCQNLASIVLGEHTLATTKLMLQLAIKKLYHEAVHEPGSVAVEIEATLVDMETRKVLHQNSFSVTEPVTSYDSNGAVAGFNKATSTIAFQIVRWLSERL